MTGSSVAEDGSPLSARPGLALVALAIGGFTIGTTEFAAMGILTDVGGAFGVPDSTAGQTISAYALGVVVGAPLLTVLAARMPRKALLVALMALYSVGNLASSFAPTFALLVAGRFFTGLSHGVFFGVGAVVGTAVVGYARRGHAVSMMMAGLTIANVVGVPLSAWVGQSMGWQWAFRLVGLLGVVTVVGVLLFVPRVAAAPGASPRSEIGALRNPPLWWGMLAGAVGFGGMFAAYSYVKPIIVKYVGADPAAVPYALAVFGVGMTIGALAGGRLADGNLRRTTRIGFVATAAALVVFGLSMGSLAGVMIGLFAVGLASQMLGIALQTTLMDLSPQAPSLGASLCHSALNLGNANGAFLGGLVLASGLDDHLRYPALAWTGVVLTIVGFGVIVLVQRGMRPPAIPPEYQKRPQRISSEATP